VSGHQTSPAQEERQTGDIPDRPIVFFDGVCGLCNKFINFLLTRDRNAQFFFAPLQGPTAQRLLDLPEDVEFDSVVFWDGSAQSIKSTAVVRILWRLGGIWTVCAALLWLIPLPLRNLGYTIVARSRYRFFGKSETCRMPTPQERERFLD